MVNAIACTIELWMHLGGLLSTQEARVALGCHLVRLLHFFRALIYLLVLYGNKRVFYTRRWFLENFEAIVKRRFLKRQMRN